MQIVIGFVCFVSQLSVVNPSILRVKLHTRSPVSHIQAPTKPPADKVYVYYYKKVHYMVLKNKEARKPVAITQQSKI